MIILSRVEMKAAYANAYALPRDDPRELLELVRPLERPLTDALLLAEILFQSCDNMTNMLKRSYPICVAALTHRLSNACAPSVQSPMQAIA